MLRFLSVTTLALSMLAGPVAALDDAGNPTKAELAAARKAIIAAGCSVGEANAEAIVKASKLSVDAFGASMVVLQAKGEGTLTRTGFTLTKGCK